MSTARTSIELKKEYWSQPDKYFTPLMVKTLVREYGDKPATTGEAVYVLRYRLLYFFSKLPYFGKHVRLEKA